MLPNPQTAAFDRANALACARWSQAAYWTPEGARAALARTQGLVDVRFINEPKTGTQAFLAATYSMVLIAFRGTEVARLADIRTDLRCKREEGVHRGFKAAVGAVIDDIIQTIRALDNRPSHIVVTGHSLGGALAMLCARMLKNVFSGVRITVYTFGQPRVFNAERADSYDFALGEQTFRVVNEEDPVARLPFWTMGYRHAGTEAFLPSLGELTFNPPLWRKLASDAIGIYDAWRDRREEILSDHFIKNYIERLEALQTNA